MQISMSNQSPSFKAFIFDKKALSVLKNRHLTHQEEIKLDNIKFLRENDKFDFLFEGNEGETLLTCTFSDPISNKAVTQKESIISVLLSPLRFIEKMYKKAENFQNNIK